MWAPHLRSTEPTQGEKNGDVARAAGAGIPNSRGVRRTPSQCGDSGAEGALCRWAVSSTVEGKIKGPRGDDERWW